MALTLRDNSTAFTQDVEEPDRYLALASIAGVVAIVACLLVLLAF
jgi:hypothetical protein